MGQLRGKRSTVGIMALGSEKQDLPGTESGITLEPRLQVSLLGEFQLKQQERVISLKIHSHQALLAYLILHAGQQHTRQHLAFTFWPDSTESQALTNLRKALHTLRQALPDADCYLDITRRTVQWRMDAPCSVDVWAFESAVNRAAQTTHIRARQTDLEQAASAYQGDFLPGYYDDWILAARETQRARYLGALDQLIRLHEEQRRYTEAISLAKTLLREDPLHEAAYRRLMRLQSLNGNVAGALRTYHTCSSVLQRELGVEPGAATLETYERLLQLQAPASPLSPNRLPLIARQRAWKGMQTAWRHSQSGGAKFVLLSGEAGIGKTRLAEEMLDWAQRQGIITLSASSYAAGGSLPYAPVADWLRAAEANNLLAGLPDKWLVEASRILPELTLARPDLAQPVPLTESWQRQHLFRALALAVLHSKRPILFFVDDLQWCDIDTLEWLQFLLHFDRQAPFLLLGAARSEEVPDGHPLTALDQNLRKEDLLLKLELERLDLPATRALAEQVTGQAMEEEQAALFYNDTEGNPLFIVEMARAGWQGAANNQQPAAQIEGQTMARLPEKVRLVIQQRLAALSPAARDLTGLAAIIGRTFTYDLLAATGDGDETALVRALDELWQQRIIREQGAEAYDFSHDKLRQVAITSLSAARQRLLHGRVIKALESFRAAGREVDDSRLGRHYAAAGRNREAIASFRRAATAAQQIYAHEEALSNLRQALDLLGHISGDDLLALELHEQTAGVLAMMGRYEETREALQTAVAHAGDPIDHARLLRKQGDAWVSQRHYDKAGIDYEAALAKINQSPEQRDSDSWWDEWINIEICRGELLYYSGQLPGLAAHIKALQALFADHGRRRHEHALLNLENMYNIASKRFKLDEEDVARSQRLLELAKQTANVNQITFMRFGLGFMYLWSGSLRQAVSVLSASLNEATEYGNLFLQDQSLAYLTLAYRRLGEEAQVRDLVARHHPISDQVLNLSYRGLLFGCEAWLSYRAGDMELAVQHGETALETLGAAAFPIRWPALWPLLAVSLKLNRPADALDYARQMLDPSQQQLEEDIATLLQEAVTAWDSGETAVSHQHLQAAVDLAQSQNRF
jgi:DNA-binding SARP family transcriptional activator